MYYQFAMLLLFRPVIKLRIIGSNVVPRDVCSQAANAIQALARSYAQLYTLRRTPSFVPYFVLAAAIVHLAIAASEPPDDDDMADDATGAGQRLPSRKPPAPKINRHAAEVMSRGIADLAEMAPCHHFAEQGLNILRSLGKKWGVDLSPADALVVRGRGAAAAAGGVRGERGAGAAISARADPDTGPDSAFKFNFVEESTRVKSTSKNFFATTVTEYDLMGSGPSRVRSTRARDIGSEKDSQQEKRIEQRSPADSKGESPLFWPFPLQGRPMLPTGAALQQAGFQML